MSYFLKKGSSIKLINEIQSALEDIIYGSIEVYVQDGKVTQITKRSIEKKDIQIQGSENESDEKVQFPNQSEITKTYIGRKD